MDYGLGAYPGTSDFFSFMLGTTMSLMPKNRCMIGDHDAPFLRQRSGRVHKRDERCPCGILVVSTAPKCASGYIVNLSQNKCELEVGLQHLD